MNSPFPKLSVARLYDPPPPDGRCRVLVDRVWPRGVRKADLDHELWLREIAPSDALRQWFAHDPLRWAEFRRRYHAELDAKPERIEALRRQAAGREILLLYGARDTRHNNATAPHSSATWKGVTGDTIASARPGCRVPRRSRGGTGGERCSKTVPCRAERCAREPAIAA